MSDKELKDDILTAEYLRENRFDSIVTAFAASCELYTVVLDFNGHILIDPSGPAPYLGEFYEIVRNPKYKKLYSSVVECLTFTRQSMFSEIDDGNPQSRFAAAPIFVDGTFYAAWILYAENKVQSQKLYKAFENLDTMATSLSDILTKLYQGSIARNADKHLEDQMRFEHEYKEIISTILEISSNHDLSRTQEIYNRIGNLLDVDYIVYYEVDDDRPGFMKLVDYWAKNGKSEEAEKSFVWDQDHYDIDIQNQIKSSGLIVDKNSMTNRMRVEVFEGNAKAVMVFPLYLSGAYHGRLIFIENTRERVWTKGEINFAKELSTIISRRLSLGNKIKSDEKVSRVVTDILEHLPIYAFVRNELSGKVLYVNKSLREKLGEDVVGRESYLLIPDVRNEFAGLDGTGAPKLGRKASRYKRYIDRLEGIYDVTEHFLKWRDGQKVSVILMKPDMT